MFETRVEEASVSGSMVTMSHDGFGSHAPAWGQVATPQHRVTERRSGRPAPSEALSSLSLLSISPLPIRHTF